MLLVLGQIHNPHFQLTDIAFWVRYTFAICRHTIVCSHIIFILIEGLHRTLMKIRIVFVSKWFEGSIGLYCNRWLCHRAPLRARSNSSVGYILVPIITHHLSICLLKTILVDSVLVSDRLVRLLPRWGDLKCWRCLLIFSVFVFGKLTETNPGKSSGIIGSSRCSVYVIPLAGIGSSQSKRDRQRFGWPAIHLEIAYKKYYWVLNILKLKLHNVYNVL